MPSSPSSLAGCLLGTVMIACSPVEAPSFTTTPTTNGSSSTSVDGGTGTTKAPSTSAGTHGSTLTTSGTTRGTTSSTVGSTAPSSAGSTTSTTSSSEVGGDSEPTGELMGCGGKIDFLFVISRQYNLDVVQAQLIDAFPKFIETIASKFDDFDFHILVAETGVQWGEAYPCNYVCPDLSCLIGDPCCDAESPEGELCCNVPDYPCGELDLLAECDGTVGAGVIFPAGHHASNKMCKVDGGRRYLTKDQGDLSETFACIAQVGTAGGNQVGAALAAAVDPFMNAPGECNDGFMRDDALLVVTMVSPGLDGSKTGTVKAWYEAVVSAKHGDPEAIVVLLLGNPECPDYDDTCKLATKFPNVILEDVEAPDYAPAFDEATSMAEDACKVLVPG